MSKGRKRFGRKTKPKTPAKKDKRKQLALDESTIRNAATQLKSEEDSVEGRVPLKGPVDRRGDNGMLLTDPHHSRLDLQLVSRAAREHWPVRRKQMIVSRLESIVEKTEAEVVTKDGVVSLESAGDKLSIEAARVLAAMDGVNLKREEVIAKIEEEKPSPTTVNVQVNNGSGSTHITVDDRRARILRLAERIGASELVIDGESIKPGELPEPAASLPKSEGPLPKA